MLVDCTAVPGDRAAADRQVLQGEIATCRHQEQAERWCATAALDRGGVADDGNRTGNCG